jgi:hypothetical protein
MLEETGKCCSRHATVNRKADISGVCRRQTGMHRGLWRSNQAVSAKLSWQRWAYCRRKPSPKPCEIRFPRESPAIPAALQPIQQRGGKRESPGAAQLCASEEDPAVRAISTNGGGSCDCCRGKRSGSASLDHASRSMPACDIYKDTESERPNPNERAGITLSPIELRQRPTLGTPAHHFTQTLRKTHPFQIRCCKKNAPSR